MTVLNLSELRGIAAADPRPATKDIDVPQWPGYSVRLRRLDAVGLVAIYDLWAELPKDSEGKADVDAAHLVQFYELLLAHTVVDESNMPLFANPDDRQILRQHPAALMFIGQAAQEFNSDVLAVKKEKKSDLPLEISPSPSVANSDTPSSTPTTS